MLAQRTLVDLQALRRPLLQLLHRGRLHHLEDVIHLLGEDWT